jgi:rubrerythrin
MLELLIKLIIYLGQRDEPRFIRLLAKIEYGVAIFCFKLAAIALEEDRHNLAKLLEKHAREEVKHGKMLSCFAGEKISLTEAGRWVEFYQDGELKIIESEDTPSKELQGIYYSGKFENLDGLSKRYLSLRMLFQGKSAADYPWEDRFAFMQVLEEVTRKFYSVLSHEANKHSLKAIAYQIATDEAAHVDYLKYASRDFYPDVIKWESRLNWAIWGLFIDIIRLCK